MIAELKFFILIVVFVLGLAMLEVLQEKELALGELQVLHHCSCQARAHQLQVQKCWSHVDLLGAERVTMVLGIHLLTLVQQRRPFLLLYFLLLLLFVLFLLH